MRLPRTRPAATLALLGLALAASGTPARADSELERLKAENARLQARVRSLEQACPAAQAAAPAAAATAPMPSATAPSAVPEATAAVAPTPATAAPAPAVTAIAAPPPGYKLVPVNTPDYVDPLAPPYTHTGCSLGFMKGPPEAKWNEKDGEHWDELERGQSMPAVEALLGKEHHDVGGAGRVQWQYGRCGDNVDGFVLFENGAVLSWRKPEF